MSYFCSMDKELRIRIDKNQKEKLKSVSKKLGLTVSAYVRLIIIKSLDNESL